MGKTRKKPRIYFTVHPQKESGVGRKKEGARVIVPWNTKQQHKRKLICRRGEYLNGSKLVEGEMYFWGEYEGPSEATVTGMACPKAVHDVLKPVGEMEVPEGALNTDPYVFGERFRHICCGIGARKFIPGDVVVFGNIEWGFDAMFLVDTVVVIGGWEDVNSTSVTPQYHKAAIEPLVKMGKAKKGYYYGVGYGKGVERFSFVPCLSELSEEACEHPKLDLEAMGFSANRGYGGTVRNATLTQEIWEWLVGSVTEQGWKLGVRVEEI